MADGVSGVVFLVNGGTVKEALSTLIFGMGSNHWRLIERISIGTPIFVYNYTTSMMYGCFKAITPGIYDLNPTAYGGRGSFPAQVKVAHDIEYQPVPLGEFQHIPGLVADGYKVSHELTHEQVAGIYEVFHQVSRAPEPAMPPMPPTMQASLPMPGEVTMPPDMLPPDLPHAMLPAAEPSRVVRSQAPFRLRANGRGGHRSVEPQPGRGGPGRGRGQLRQLPVDGTPYGPDLGSTLPGGKTTLKLQNIPGDWSASGIADLLDNLGFADTYDFFIFKPFADFSRTTGMCIVNMISHEHANALLQASRQLEAFWPVPHVPQPPWPVRWNLQQGWAQLTHVNPQHVVVDGSPSAWELPNNKALFFKLPAAGHPGPLSGAKRPFHPSQKMGAAKRQKFQQRAEHRTFTGHAAPLQRAPGTTNHQPRDAVRQPAPASKVPTADFSGHGAASKANDLERRLNSALGSKPSAASAKPKPSTAGAAAAAAAAAPRRTLLSFDETIRRRKEAESAAKEQPPSARSGKESAPVSQRLSVIADAQQAPRQSSAQMAIPAMAAPSSQSEPLSVGKSLGTHDRSEGLVSTSEGCQGVKHAKVSDIRGASVAKAQPSPDSGNQSAPPTPDDTPKEAPLVEPDGTQRSISHITADGTAQGKPTDELDDFLHSVVRGGESTQADAEATTVIPQIPAASPNFDYDADFISF